MSPRDRSCGLLDVAAPRRSGRLTVDRLLRDRGQLLVGRLFLVEVLLEAALQALSLVVSFGVITLLFALMFKWLPDTEVEWRDVWLGAVITALLFEIGKSLIGLYIGKQGLESTYGAASSIVVVLVWVYYSAQIVLFGAELTNVRAKQNQNRTAPRASAT
jgi:membrane protein